MSCSSELRKRRIESGVCGHCGKRPLCSNTECEVCREKRLEYQKRAYKTGSTSKSAEAVRRTRKKRLSEGRCGRCGKEKVVPGLTTCQKCSDSAKQQMTRAKDEVFAAYGGYKCSCCEEDIPEFLTLDHVNGDGAEHRRKIRQDGRGFYNWIIRNKFPPIFQVLCYNCNCGRQRNGGVCPHKTRQSSEPSLRDDRRGKSGHRHF